MLHGQALRGLFFLGQVAGTQLRQQRRCRTGKAVGQSDVVCQTPADAGLRAKRRRLGKHRGFRMHQERGVTVQIGPQQSKSDPCLSPVLNDHELQLVAQEVFRGLLVFTIDFDAVGQHADRPEVAGRLFLDQAEEILDGFRRVGVMREDLVERLAAGAQPGEFVAKPLGFVASRFDAGFQVRDRGQNLPAPLAQVVELRLPALDGLPGFVPLPAELGQLGFRRGLLFLDARELALGSGLEFVDLGQLVPVCGGSAQQVENEPPLLFLLLLGLAQERLLFPNLVALVLEFAAEPLYLSGGSLQRGLLDADLFVERGETLVEPDDLGLVLLHALSGLYHGARLLGDAGPDAFDLDGQVGEFRSLLFEFFFRGLPLLTARPEGFLEFLDPRASLPLLDVGGRQFPFAELDSAVQVVVARGHQDGKVLVALLLEFLEAPRARSLPLERIHLTHDFLQDVVDAVQVLLRAFELEFRQPFAGLELGDARGLFDDRTAIERTRAEDLPDAALLDNGVVFGAEAGSEKDILDVAKPAELAVDQVLALPRPEKLARDGQLGGPAVGRAVHAVCPVGPVGRHSRLGLEMSLGVQEGEAHRRHARRFAVARPVEDHVLHAAAPQRLRRALTQHPTDRVADVRLAAAVGAYDGRDAAAVERQFLAVAERLEPDQLDLLQFQQESEAFRVRDGAGLLSRTGTFLLSRDGGGREAGGSNRPPRVNILSLIMHLVKACQRNILHIMNSLARHLAHRWKTCVLHVVNRL